MLPRTSRLRRTLVAAFGALVLSAAAPPLATPAHAQTTDEINQARTLAKDGFTAYKASDFKKALALFEQARKLYPSAQILRLNGYSLLALEQWEKAADLMDASVTSTVGPLEADDKKDVAENLAKAMIHLGTLQVTTTVAGAELYIDERPVLSLPLDKPVRLLAGKHKLVVKAPEHTDAQQEVTLEGNGKLTEVKLSPVLIPKKVEAPPPPPPKPPPPPPPPKGWIPMQYQIGLIASGAGLALGVGAIVTGAGAVHLTDQVNRDIDLHKKNYGENCDKHPTLLRDCQFDRFVINFDSDRANTLTNIALGTGIAGGVLLAGGVTLFLFAPEGPLGPKPKPAPADTESPPKAAARPTAMCAPLLTGGLTCAGTF